MSLLVADARLGSSHIAPTEAKAPKDREIDQRAKNCPDLTNQTGSAVKANGVAMRLHGMPNNI